MLQQKKIEYIFIENIKSTKYADTQMSKENNMIGRPGDKSHQKIQKNYKNIAEEQQHLSLDKKRSLNCKEKQAIWEKTKTHKDLNPSFFRMDEYNNVIIKTIRYSKDNVNRVFAGEFEHIKPYSKGGRTDTTNICLLNAGFNRSKGTKELGTLDRQSAIGYSVIAGTLSADQLVIELDRDLHTFCTKYNILIEKKNKLYSIGLKDGSFKPYTGEYAQEYKDYSKAPEFKPLSNEYQEHLKQEYNPTKSYAPEYNPTKSYAPEYNPTKSYAPEYKPTKSYAPEYKPTKSYAPEYKPYNNNETSPCFIYPKKEIQSQTFILPKKKIQSHTFIYPKKEIQSHTFILPKKKIQSQTFIYPKKEIQSQTFILPKNKEYNEYTISDDSSKYTGDDDYGFIKYELPDDEDY